MNENIVLIDWVSITSKEIDETGFKKLLGMFCSEVHWTTGKGAKGYKERQYFNGISILYDGRDDMGVWCEMSGQGCRTFESFGSGSYETLFNFVLEGHGNLTRLDVAYDDHSGVLPIDSIAEDAIHGEFVSKSRFWEVVMSSKGKCIYHGSPQSDIRIRIYDKAAERNCDPGTHWVRVELQLRDKRALEFVKLDYEIGTAFVGVLCNYLRYVDPDELDSNRWRWPVKDYWAALLLDASPIKLYVKPGIDYNLYRCENYVYKYAGNAIDALIDIYGVGEFLEKLKNRGTLPNPKYQQLIDLYRQRERESLETHWEDVDDDSGNPWSDVS